MNRRDLFRYSAIGAIASLAESISPPLVWAEDKTPSGDVMIRKYLAAETKRLSAKFMDGITTRAEWEKARPRLKREFLDMLGLDPLPEKTPLKATVTGTHTAGDIAIDKLHFQSRPGLYVTANLFRPKTLPKDAKLPGVLYVCGHSNKGRDGNKTAYQDHGLWFASNGYVCLMLDTLQLGEIAGKHHGTYNLNRFWWHSRGYTPAGVECWNGIRGIDYLCSLPYVDADKIGVTGISGGGASTNWICAADDRVRVAVPVSGVSDLECYVTDQVINGHCDCMFFHNLYQWEWTTALALFAPKPLLFANSDDDKIFPMTGNKRIIERLRKCYELLGEKDNVDEHVSKGGHAYRPDLRVAVFSFFHKHLKGDKAAVKDAEFEKIDGKDLRVFPEDKDIPKDAINATADETFVPVAKVELPTEKNFKEWKAGLVKQLREKVFRALPEKIPGAKFSRSFLTVERWTPEEGIEFWIDELHSRGPGFPMRLEFPPPLVAVLNVDEPEAGVKKWLERTRLNMRFVSPRGIGWPEGSRWAQKNPPNTVERSLPLLGQTVDSGRVRDVAAYLVQVPKEDGKTKLYGREQAGIIAAYATLFVPDKVEELTIVDPPISHLDGPHFLNVMRVLDVPEALGLLAPDVKLTLVGKNAKDKAFNRTETIYAAAGAKEKFKRE